MLTTYMPDSFFAERLSRRHVRILLQGVNERRPRFQHLWYGALREDNEHLHTPPSLLPTFKTCVRTADRLTVIYEPTAGRAHQGQQSEQVFGCSPKQLLSEPLPKPASTGACRVADVTTSTSEHLPAEGLRLRGPEDLQEFPVKCFKGIEISKKQSVQDIIKHILFLRMT